MLLDEESPAYLAPVARFLVAEAGQAPALLRAYRTGGGVPYAAYGADAREAQAAFNRPAFAHLLADRWLPALPDVHARLQAAPPARVADVGCGAGWASIALARAFPAARIDGFDADEASVALAQRNAATAGVADRVAFRTLDVGAPAAPGRAEVDEGGYDLVLAFETIHDLARPVEALATMRRLARPGAAVLVAEHRVGEAFAAPGDPIERLVLRDQPPVLPAHRAGRRDAGAPRGRDGHGAASGHAPPLRPRGRLPGRGGAAYRARPVPLLPPPVVRARPRRAPGSARVVTPIAGGTDPPTRSGALLDGGGPGTGSWPPRPGWGARAPGAPGADAQDGPCAPGAPGAAPHPPISSPRRRLHRLVDGGPGGVG